MPDQDTTPALTDRWVEAHADALYRYALTRLRRRQDAEDAVQETLLAALRGRADFRGDANERTWLIGILRHKVIDRIRQAEREAATDIGGDSTVWDAAGKWLHPPSRWQTDPQTLAEDREFAEVLRRCFGALPMRQAQALTLRTLDGLPPDEVCAALKVSAENLWVLLHRARLRLRGCLDVRWFGKDKQP